MKTRYVSQEGRDFFVYKDDLGYDLEQVVTYPGDVPIVSYPVPHYDRAAEIRAYNWFRRKAKRMGIITPMF